MAILTVTGVTKAFGGVVALDGADLSVEPGTLTGLIGPNGAGKSTLFNVISGFISPDSGSIRFNGVDIAGARADQVTAAGLVRTFQIPRPFARMSVMENLLAYAQGHPGDQLAVSLFNPRRAARAEADVIDRAHAIAERLGLSAVLDNRANEISGGQKKLVEIGRALMAQPRMILLDEPMAGVNPTLAETIAGHLVGMVKDGITLLLIEHNMGMIGRLCDPVIVMAQGKHLTSGRFADVAADPGVQEVYMGKRARQA